MHPHAPLLKLAAAPPAISHVLYRGVKTEMAARVLLHRYRSLVRACACVGGVIGLVHLPVRGSLRTWFSSVSSRRVPLRHIMICVCVMSVPLPIPTPPHTRAPNYNHIHTHIHTTDGARPRGRAVHGARVRAHHQGGGLLPHAAHGPRVSSVCVCGQDD